MLGYEDALRELNEAWGLVTHLDAVCNSPALREAHNKMLPQVSAFFAKIPLNEHLWDLLLTFSKTDGAKALTGTRRRAVDETLAYFRQHGAELPAEKKKRLEERSRASCRRPRRSIPRTSSTPRMRGNW